MTVGEFLERVDSEEIALWKAYADIDQEDDKVKSMIQRAQMNRQKAERKI